MSCLEYQRIAILNDYYHQLGSSQIPAGPMKEIDVEVDKMNRNLMAISRHSLA